MSDVEIKTLTMNFGPQHPAAGEMFVGTTARERGKYLRGLYAEITATLNPLWMVTLLEGDGGALPPPLWGFEQRELLMEYYEGVSGSRMHANYFRPGGVH